MKYIISILTICLTLFVSASDLSDADFEEYIGRGNKSILKAEFYLSVINSFDISKLNKGMQHNVHIIYDNGNANDIVTYKITRQDNNSPMIINAWIEIGSNRTVIMSLEARKSIDVQNPYGDFTLEYIIYAMNYNSVLTQNSLDQSKIISKGKLESDIENDKNNISFNFYHTKNDFTGKFYIQKDKVNDTYTSLTDINGSNSYLYMSNDKKSYNKYDQGAITVIDTSSKPILHSAIITLFNTDESNLIVNKDDEVLCLFDKSTAITYSTTENPTLFVRPSSSQNILQLVKNSKDHIIKTTPNLTCTITRAGNSPVSVEVIGKITEIIYEYKVLNGESTDGIIFLDEASVSYPDLTNLNSSHFKLPTDF